MSTQVNALARYSLNAKAPSQFFVHCVCHDWLDLGGGTESEVRDS